MLRAVSSIYIEGQALELLTSTRRDVFKLFRTSSRGVAVAGLHSQTVLTTTSRGEGAAPPSPPAPAPPPSPSPPPPPRYAWHAVATALAVTASLGGAYYYRKLNEDKALPVPQESSDEAPERDEYAPPPPVPSSGEQFPKHVQYLLVGAGTASFAAMRAIRAARPDAHVLMVGEESELPYMRPPLSKELWREPDVTQGARDPDALTFRQWNGRRRALVYEPPAFYAPVRPEGGGASVARGWRVERLDVVRHEAELRAPGVAPATHTLTYDKCLVAPGVRPRRVPALRAAAAAGRSLPLRTVRDATRLARELERDDVRRVAVLGGGFLATELSAALADRLRGSGRSVVQVYRESLPLGAVLPRYLAAETARRLADAGVTLLPEAEVVSSSVESVESVEGPMSGGAVRLQLAAGGALAADLVLECVGSEPDEALARRSQLETHPALGGVLVNAELQARHDVYAAGDVACFYDVALGRRRVEHHDHAVVSGRLAGENMAAVAPPKHYTHQSMFWSDLGPDLGYEAIGIVDSRLRTVGVFSEDAVSSVTESATVVASGEGSPAVPAATAAAPEAVAVEEDEASSRRYARGVVFYLRDERVVGVLLWNLFNRMHVARQVLAHGEFDDLFEVAKLFSLHEEE